MKLPHVCYKFDGISTNCILERIKLLQTTIEAAKQKDREILQECKRRERETEAKYAEKMSVLKNEIAKIEGEFDRLRRIKMRLAGKLRRYETLIGKSSWALYDKIDANTGWRDQHEMKLELGRLSREMAKRIAKG